LIADEELIADSLRQVLQMDGRGRRIRRPLVAAGFRTSLKGWSNET
jgi:hypothetical protein